MDTSSAGQPSSAQPSVRAWRYRAIVVAIVKWAVVVAAMWFFTTLVRRINWAEVADGLGHLHLWHVLVLLCLLLARQTLNSVTLALFVPGLKLRQAIANDYSGSLVATMAPAPSDIVLRLAMFKSWGVEPASGLTGLTLNNIVYYINRFGAPILGFLLILAWDGFDAAYAWPALSGGLIAVSVLAATVLALRAQRPAAAVGRLIGHAATTLRIGNADIATWENRLIDFQATASERLRSGAVGAAGVTAGVLVLDATMLVLSMRFVGVSADQAATVLIVASFFCVYPLTALPLSGLGVLDAALVTLVTDRSIAQPEYLIAGLAVFRIYQQIVPLAIGAGVLLHWKRPRGEHGQMTMDRGNV